MEMAAAANIATASEPMLHAVVDDPSTALPLGVSPALLLSTRQPEEQQQAEEEEDGVQPIEKNGAAIPSNSLEDCDGAPASGSPGLLRPQALGGGRGGGGSNNSGGRPDEPPGLAPVEVFVGGLPPNAADFDVFLALANAGEVLSVKLFRRGRDKGECRGYGLVLMASQADAERAVAEVTQACGCTVAVSIPGGADVARRDAAVLKGPVLLRRLAPSQVAAAAAAMQPEGDEASVGVKQEEGGVIDQEGVVKLEPAEAQQQQQQENGAVMPAPAAPPMGTLARLLRIIRQYGDNKAEVTSAAFATLFAMPGRPKLAFTPERPYRPPQSDAAAAAPSSPQGGEAVDVAGAPLLPVVDHGPPLPDMRTYIDAYPRCKSLIEKLRTGKPTGAKTPLQVVNEYASRLMMEVLYDERAESQLGPFSVEAKLIGRRGQQLLATGTGRGRSKQLAKQVAGAALLESLLATVPESDFLMTGRARENKTQYVNPRLGLGVVGGRGFRSRGRSGMRATAPSFTNGGLMQPHSEGGGFDFQPHMHQAADRVQMGSYSWQYQQDPKFSDPSTQHQQDLFVSGSGMGMPTPQHHYPTPANPRAAGGGAAAGYGGAGAIPERMYSGAGVAAVGIYNEASVTSAGVYSGAPTDPRDPRRAARGGAVFHQHSGNTRQQQQQQYNPTVTVAPSHSQHSAVAPLGYDSGGTDAERGGYGSQQQQPTLAGPAYAGMYAGSAGVGGVYQGPYPAAMQQIEQQTLQPGVGGNPLSSAAAAGGAIAAGGNTRDYSGSMGASAAQWGSAAPGVLQTLSSVSAAPASSAYQYGGSSGAYGSALVAAGSGGSSVVYNLSHISRGYQQQPQQQYGTSSSGAYGSDTGAAYNPAYPASGHVGFGASTGQYGGGTDNGTGGLYVGAIGQYTAAAAQQYNSQNTAGMQQQQQEYGSGAQPLGGSYYQTY